MRFGLALATIVATTAFTATSAFLPAHQHQSLIRTSQSEVAPSFAHANTKRTNLQMTATTFDAKTAIDASISEAGDQGVTLFGKSACPFCIKAKKALYSIGVHATIVELDQVEGGPAIQKQLEELTEQATVPSVWLDGKFIGGSEEVLKGVEDGLFDDVEKKEIIEMEDAPKIPVKQGENAVKVGDKISSAQVWSVFDNDPATYIDLSAHAKDKNLLIVGLPGAFTPTCSGQQVPSYLEYSDKLKKAGIDGVIIYCVNDPAVMAAWAKDQGVDNWEINNDDGFVSFIADPSSSFTSDCGMELAHEGPTGKGLLQRCKRFAMYVVDGVVKAVNVSEYEGDPAGDDYPDLTLPPAMIEAIKKA